ncbi:MAG: hypothetical protein WCT31_04185, partial [Candidatus Micrarchaeia archaeon]
MLFGRRELFVAFFLVLSLSSFSFAETIYVNSTGAGTCVQGTNYSTIQAAVDAASAGDTIFVCNDNPNRI